MRVLVIGSGGREHALCWRLSKSSRLTKLFCTPGNGGISSVSECFDLDLLDHPKVIKFCQNEKIDLVIIGPEAPLVDGLGDSLRAQKIAVFGPNQQAAQLEGSKDFTKKICDEASIPTARYATFEMLEPALEYIRKQGAPIVIKADGLAAGKGVVVAHTLEEAEKAVQAIFDGAFGSAGARVVIEECMVGEEVSFFALCDGTHILPIGTAQDHKRVGEGETGLNTGGMGAYSPAPLIDEKMSLSIMEKIIQPTIDTLNKKEMPFCGVLYAGLMMTKDGPKLVEYNARFGDPECQILMMRLKSDLLELLYATALGTLNQHCVKWDERPALTVVMAAQGYPEAYAKGTHIKGLKDAEESDEDVIIFHAGTRKTAQGFDNIGGRVLNISALGESFDDAKAKVDQALSHIDWPEGFYRRDIGWRVLKS